MSRWIRVQVSIFEHALFQKEPLSEREAWLWLISKAAWKDTKHRVGQAVHEVPAGSVFLTLREMQSAWRWKSDKRVRSFLSVLENEGMIELIADAKKTRISICNYSHYQEASRDADASRTQTGRKRDAKTDAKKTQATLWNDLENPEAGRKEDASGTQTETQNGRTKDTNTPTTNNTSSLRSDVTATPRSELAKVLDQDRSKAVVEHRQKIRKPLTAHAAKLLAGKFSKWPDPNEAADIMISNGWQGFEPEWVAGRSRGSIREPPKSAFQEHQDRATATLERALKRGNDHDERNSFDDGQPAFDLAPGDFRTVRKAGAGQ